jgi:thymidylate kinase
MIIIVEGMDSAGKSTLIKLMSHEFLMMSIINTKETHQFVKFEEQPYEWKYFVAGFLMATLDTFKNFDNFIKDRFHLSEYVYSTFFKRESFYDFVKIEDLLISYTKNIKLILCDVSYEQYKSRHIERGEKYLSEGLFFMQKQLFYFAFANSKLSKLILNSDESVDVNKLKYFIEENHYDRI